MSKDLELKKVLKSWQDCTRCELCKTRKNIVFYRGSPTAKLMIIGEGPGAAEDEEGIPFVGKAGKTLDRLLRAAGVKPRQAFITNMVCCRPPGNRQPEFRELLACLPRLEYCMKAVNPKAILLLGAAAASMAGITKVTAWRGKDTSVVVKLGRIKTFPAIVTFHPSYLNRKGNDHELENLVIKDIRKAFRLAYYV